MMFRTLLLCCSLAVPAVAQRPGRSDVTGPFGYAGVIVGSVTRQSGPVGDSNGGWGWSAGAGLGVNRAFAIVANYSIFNFHDDGAAESSPMEQSDAGVRFRVGGPRSPVIFYLEGGAGVRKTSLAPSRLFATPPEGAGATIDADGIAGWFGPGFQLFVKEKFAGEVSVAWAWGTFGKAHLQGNTIDADTPVGLTTLRLRFGASATVF